MKTKTNLQSNAVDQVVHRNIRSLLQLRERQEAERTRHQVLVDGITGWIGHISFIYVTALVTLAWIALNMWSPFGLGSFDPYPFVGLGMVTSVASIFMTTFVLISQNRMDKLASRRADLDVQIGLLSEHEITQLARMIERIAQRLDIDLDSDARQIEKDVPPERILREIEENELRH